MDVQEELIYIARAQMKDKKGRFTDPEAMAVLINNHSGFIGKMASRYSASATSMEHQDLFNEGVLGLMIAVERFELERPTRFLTYAAWWIRNAIQNAYTYRDPMYRTGNRTVPRANQLVPGYHLTLTLEEIAVARPDVNPDDVDTEVQLVRFEDVDFTVLDERETKIVDDYYVHGKTLEKIGEGHHLTKERIRQILVAAKKKLKSSTLINNQLKAHAKLSD